MNQSKEWPENIGVGKPYDPDEREQDFLLALAYDKIGENQKSEALLKNVVDFTKNTDQKNTINHLYGLLAARKLEDVNADKLLEYLNGSIDTKHQKGLIALALFQNKMESAMALKEESKIPDDVWEGLQAALKF